MGFRFYRLKILARIGVLFLSLLFLVYSIMAGERYVSMVVFILLIAFELAELFRYLDRSNREITAFVEHVRQRDYSASFPKVRSSSDFPKLRSVLDAIIDDLRDSRLEAEKQFSYLQMVVSHIQTGLVCLEEGGKVILANAAFQKITGIREVKEAKTDAGSERVIRFLEEGRAGEKLVVRIVKGGRPLQLLLHMAGFRTGGKNYKLCSVQDIRHELEGRESESWSKLIRVMTHEIMNSVTPINSLSEAMLEELEETKIASREDLNDLVDSATTIHERTQGLMRFIHNYRSLSMLSEPVFEKTDLRHVVNQTVSLLKRDLEENDIQWRIDISGHTHTVDADQEMIVRVLINVIRNAIEALTSTENPEIIMTIEQNASLHRIGIHDNGPGIQPENAGEVFIPFYTTKKGGSGIGLSICRQIMDLHRGSVYAIPRNGGGVSFYIEF